jgi:hypothetical protein
VNTNTILVSCDGIRKVTYLLIVPVVCADLVKCPGGTGAEGLELCYTNSRGDPGAPCSTECLGGCTGPNPNQCTACTNMRWADEGCTEKCPGLPWLSVSARASPGLGEGCIFCLL